MSTELRNFLALPYDELEELNLKAKKQRLDRVAPHKVQEERIKYLSDEKRIKAVTVLFSDLEGRLHMLDYDKKFIIKSYDNLTFDGSSIRGFTRLGRPEQTGNRTKPCILEYLYCIILLMADIRKRKGSKGITYQVRYPTKATKSGYAYKTFVTAKEAREFREQVSAHGTVQPPMRGKRDRRRRRSAERNPDGR